MNKDLIAKLREIRRNIVPLTAQGEDRVWRPTTRACALIDEILTESITNGYSEVFTPMPFEHPVGNDLAEWREAVGKTQLYRNGDTVLVWVNEGDLYPDGPFTKKRIKADD